MRRPTNRSAATSCARFMYHSAQSAHSANMVTPGIERIRQAEKIAPMPRVVFVGNGLSRQLSAASERPLGPLASGCGTTSIRLRGITRSLHARRQPEFGQPQLHSGDVLLE